MHIALHRKRTYASTENTGRELRDMVKSCHHGAGIEVVFKSSIFRIHYTARMMEECLRILRAGISC